jgi:hypothetical protein
MRLAYHLYPGPGDLYHPPDDELEPVPEMICANGHQFERCELEPHYDGEDEPDGKMCCPVCESLGVRENEEFNGQITGCY